MNLNVVQFPEMVARDPAKMLRRLADEIEAGGYGEVGSCGVVIFGDTMEVFGAGVDSAGPTIALLFNAAAQRFAQAIEQHGQ